MPTPQHHAPAEHTRTRRPAPPAPAPQRADVQRAPGPLAGLGPAILSDTRLAGRGNGLLRQAAVQQMQQQGGNRATRRLLQRAAAPPQPVQPTALFPTPLARRGLGGAATLPAAQRSRQPWVKVQRVPVKTYGGTFSDVTYKAVEGGKDRKVGAVMELAFTPEETVISPKIGLVQTVKAVEGGTLSIDPGRKDLKERAQKTGDLDEGRYLDRAAPQDTFGNKMYQENPVFGMDNQTNKDKRSLGGGTSRTKTGHEQNYIERAELKRRELAGEDVADQLLALNSAPTKATGQYGFRKTDGGVQDATLRDEPSRPDTGKAIDMSFEVAALALEGDIAGTYLGTVQWGFKYNPGGSPTLYPFKTLSMGVPSKAFMKSAELWNKQSEQEMHTGTLDRGEGKKRFTGEKRGFLYLPAQIAAGTMSPQRQIAAIDTRLTILERELAQTRRPLSDTDKTNKQLEIKTLQKQKVDIRDEQQLMNADTLKALAGSKSNNIGTTYNKVVHNLGKALGTTNKAHKLEALKDAKTQAEKWLVKNKDRTESNDIRKKEHLPVLVRQIALETHDLSEPQALDPERRAAFISEDKTIRYTKVHVADRANIEKEYNKVFGDGTFIQVLKNYYTKQLQGRGDSEVVFEQLLADFPGNDSKLALEGTYRTLHGELKFKAISVLLRRRQGFAPQLIGMATLHTGNRPALEDAVMNFIALNMAQLPAIEKDWNEVAPDLTPVVADAPATLGTLIAGYLTRTFTARGSAASVYENIQTTYPALDYLIKPVYRQLFGESKLQETLRSLRDTAMAIEVPDKDSVGNQDAKRLFLAHAPFTLTNFVPGTGIGKFDAAYNPATSKLKITVKVAFDFVDFDQADLADTGGETPELAKQFGGGGWSTTAKQEWAKDFKDHVRTIWSGKHIMECIRPGWEDVIAETEMELLEVAPDLAHYKTKVSKSALLKDKTKGKKLASASPNSSVGRDGTASLQQFDVADKISDPSVHAYLHDGEAKHIKNAYEGDHKRLTGALGSVGRVAFDDNFATRMKILGEELQRLNISSSLTRLHPLVVEGNSVTGTAGPAGKVGAAGKNRLETAGVRHPLTVGVGAEKWSGVNVKAAPQDPKIQQTYVDNWERISAAHEYGHMLGLVDEYNAAASTETVKEMISAGLLPPNTPVDHLSRGGQNIAGSQGPVQKGFMKLLKSNNLDTPDFTQDQGEMTTSIMTAGFDVMAQHYVTAWEALTRMTDPPLGEKFWKIRS